MFQRALVAIALIAASPCLSSAIRLTLTDVDLKSAMALARWPTTERDRARFHERYTFLVDTVPVDKITVQQIEVVTEYARLELIAEEHARLNDTFGLGGEQEGREAIRPWQNIVAVVAYLELPDPEMAIPSIDIDLGGGLVKETRRSYRAGLYAHSGLPPQSLQGTLVEAAFAPASVGQTTREVRVLLNGREVARTTIDFGRLE